MNPSQRHSVRPGVEVLDTRLVPAVADIQIFLQGRTLVVQGTNDSESITVLSDSHGVGVFVADEGDPLQLFAIMPTNFVQQVKIVGRGGDDSIQLTNTSFNQNTGTSTTTKLTVPALVFAGDGDDTVAGGLG